MSAPTYRFRLDYDAASPLSDALAALPFSEELKVALWNELTDPGRFPSGGAGVFDSGHVTAAVAGDGVEPGHIFASFGLGRRGEVLAAAFRALRDDTAAGHELDHVDPPLIPTDEMVAAGVEAKWNCDSRFGDDDSLVTSVWEAMDRIRRLSLPPRESDRKSRCQM